LKAKELFEFKNWVVIGSTTKTDKYAHKILNALKNSNFNAVGVSPTDKTGEAFKSLELVPYKIDCIDLCINPIFGLEHVKKAKELGIDKILVQPGAQSIEILTYCEENNITAIQDCALVQLRLLK
jgi:predicted CoA-binding protein